MHELTMAELRERRHALFLQGNRIIDRSIQRGDDGLTGVDQDAVDRIKTQMGGINAELERLTVMATESNLTIEDHRAWLAQHGDVRASRARRR